MYALHPCVTSKLLCNVGGMWMWVWRGICECRIFTLHQKRVEHDFMKDPHNQDFKKYLIKTLEKSLSGSFDNNTF